MALNQCVLHKLSRTHNNASERLNDHLLPAEETILSIYQQLLNNSQKSARLEHGIFDSEVEAPHCLPLIKEYSEKKIDLLGLSQRLAKHLSQLLSDSPDPYTYFMLIGSETFTERERVMVFLLGTKTHYQIDGDLNALETECVDLGSPLAVWGIDVTNFQGDTDDYLRLIPARGEETLKSAFAQFAEFTAPRNRAEQTEQLLTSAAKFIRDNESEDKIETLIQVCQDNDKIGAPIELPQLAEDLALDNKDIFVESVAEQTGTKADEGRIHLHRGAIKKFVRFYGRDEKVSISFSSTMLDNGVSYDKANGHLVLETLPKGLKAQLHQHFYPSDNT